MQQVRIICVVDCADEATAQLACDAVVEALLPFGGRVETAPWTKDLTAARKAEFAAEQTRKAEEQARADRTAADVLLEHLKTTGLPKTAEEYVDLVTKATGVSANSIG